MIPEEINAALDAHYKSNNGAHKCIGIGLFYNFAYMQLSGCSRLRPAQVAAFIFRKFPDVMFVNYPGVAFSRETLRMAGYKFKEK